MKNTKTTKNCIAAVQALAAVIPEEELSADYIIPDVFNPKVTEYIDAREKYENYKKLSEE